jgi:hypothetical protein
MILSGATDPYAVIRRKLRRMAPLVNLDQLLARRDVQILKVWNGNQVCGVAAVLTDAPAPGLQLQLYYADEASAARELMRLLDSWLSDHATTDVMLQAA